VRVVVAITGASGVTYAETLLRHLRGEVELIVSRDAEPILAAELGRDAAALGKLASAVYRADDMTAPPASGSHVFDAMVIVPCSGTTASKIAVGIADNLITRGAAVCLKEGRKLIVVPRETPLGEIQLRNLLALARAGAVVLPAMPGFYHGPHTIQDLVDFVVARILDQLGVEHTLSARWGDVGGAITR